LSVSSYENLQQTIELMENADRLISGRFHAMVLGWMLNKPQLVVKYSDKTNNVINDLFPGQFSIDTGKLDLISSFDLRKKMNTMSNKSLIETEKNASRQFHQLKLFLQNSD